MRIVVVGCGKIGKTIISNLIKEKHEVLAIDNDPSIVAEVSNLYDVMTICGNGAEHDKLKEAKVGKADLFIAVTSSDELNMLACFAAKRMGAKHTVARIRDASNNADSLEFMQKQLELSVAVNPEKRTAHAIYNLLKLPSASKVETFGNHGFEMIELTVRTSSAMDGVSLIELKKKFKADFLVCAVGRDDEMFIPKGDFTLQAGDKVGLIISEENTTSVLKTLGIVNKPVRNVIVLGAGRTSHYLAEILLKHRIAVKIIEQDKARCEEVSERFPNADVICGDGMSEDLLTEEGIDNADALVSLTGRDEENILISFYAMSRSVPKVIAKVNRGELSALAEKLGLETIVSPQTTVADIMVRYARALQMSVGSEMEKLYSLMNGKAEGLEFNVLPSFPFCDVPLKQLKFKSDVLLAGILRGKEKIIPCGDDAIKSGDKVILIAKECSVYSLTDVIDGEPK